MELSFQSVMSPTPSSHAHGRSGSQSKPRANKISQKISTLKGIIRIPTRRSSTRDDITITSLSSLPGNPSVHQQHQHQQQPLHQRSRSTATDHSLAVPIIDIGDAQTHRRWVKSKNNPYRSFSSSRGDKDVGLKPYMSQPMLGTELLRDTAGGGDGDGGEMEERGRSRGSSDYEDGEVVLYPDQQRHHHDTHTFGDEDEDGQSQSGSGSGSGEGGSGSPFDAVKVGVGGGGGGGGDGGFVPRGGSSAGGGGVVVPSPMSTPPSVSSKPAFNSHPLPPLPPLAMPDPDSHPPPPLVHQPRLSTLSTSTTNPGEGSRPTTPGRPFTPSTLSLSVAVSGSKSKSKPPPPTQEQAQAQQQHGRKFSISNALFGGSGAHAGLSSVSGRSGGSFVAATATGHPHSTRVYPPSRPRTSDGLGSDSRLGTGMRMGIRSNGVSGGDGVEGATSITASNQEKTQTDAETQSQTPSWSSKTTGKGTHHARAPSRDLPPLPPLSPLEDTLPIPRRDDEPETDESYSGYGSGSSAKVDLRLQDPATVPPPQARVANASSVVVGGNIDTIVLNSRLDSNSNPSIRMSTAMATAVSAIPTTTTITTTTVPILTTTPSPSPFPPPALRLSVSAGPSFHSPPLQPSAPEGHMSSYIPSSSSSSHHTMLPNRNTHLNPDFNPSLPPPILTLTTSDKPAISSSSSSLAVNDNHTLSVAASNIADIATSGVTPAGVATTTTTKTTSTATSTVNSPSAASTTGQGQGQGPRLKRPPPNHRFSLTFSSSTSSMPGGMPILPLPAVPIYGGGGVRGVGVNGEGEKPNGNGDSRAKRLSGMPALHLQGTGRGTRAHEEVDEEEEEEGEEEEEEDDIGEGELSRSSISSEMSVSSNEGYSNSVSSSSEAMATLGSRTTIASLSSRDHVEDDGDDDEGDDDDDSRSIASRSSSYRTAPMDQSSAPGSTSHLPLPLPSPIPGPSSSSLEPRSYFGDTTRPPDKRFSRPPLLPPVETGKLELDFSFLDKPPPPNVLGTQVGGISKKGKGRANNRHTVDLDRRTEDAGRTPIGRRGTTPWGSSSGRNPPAATAAAPAQVDYFGQSYPYPQRPAQELRDGRTFSDRTIQGVQAGNSSPTRTPRAEDYFQSLNVMTPTMGSRVSETGLPAHTMPPMPQRSSEARLSSRLSITQHPGIYKHASRSLIDVHAAEKKEKVEQMVREEEEAEEEDRKRRVKALRMSMKAVVRGTPYEETNDYLGGIAAGSSAISPFEAGAEGALVNNSDNGRDPGRASDTAKAGGVEVFSSAGSCSASGVIGLGEGKDGSAAAAAGLNKRISMAPPYEALSHPLRKRRSMPTFTATTAPPPYPDFAPHPAFGLKNIRIMPREDEGKEKLPPYTNDIKLMAIMPRKLEFSKPGIQARDRKWRRVLCVLEGTMFKVYKAPSGASGVSAIGEWWESKVGVGDVALQAPSTTSSFQTSSGANGPSRRLSGTNPGDFIRGSGEEGVRAAIAAVEQAEREEEERRERNLVRARKNGEVEVGVQSPVADSPGAESPVQVQVPPVLQVQTQGHHRFQANHGSHDVPFGSGGLIPATRSALNLAVQLLKPGGSSRHGRSNSDVCLSPTRPRSPRSSLNIPRSGRTTPTSSLRSRSPTPSPSLINHSRPSTPATSISVSSTSQTQAQSQSQSHTGFRVGAGAMAPRPGHPRVNVSLTPREKEKEKAKEKVIEPQESDLIRVYTMQNAESGLGSDYLKRKHVIRVRLEGEQFLLQAKDVDSVISWIEGLQSATNIALDLDQRPMPRGPIFPRRRRRRRVQPPSINTNTGNVAPANPSPTGQTPVSASHLAAPLTRSARRG